MLHLFFSDKGTLYSCCSPSHQPWIGTVISVFMFGFLGYFWFNVWWVFDCFTVFV